MEKKGSKKEVSQDKVELRWTPLEGDGLLAEIILNRPDAANAIDIDLIEGVIRSCDEIESKGAECRAVLLRGAGKNFCAGGDFRWFAKAKDLPKEENLREAERLYQLFESIYQLGAPVIALVQGAAFGGGVGLVASCDFAICDAATKFSLSEVRRGLSATVLIPSLSRKIPDGILRRWVLSGEVFGAKEALAGGLVGKFLKKEGFQKAVRKEIELLLLGEPHSQRGFKGNFRRYQDGSRGTPWKSIAATTVAEGRISDGAKEGMAAFFGKRSPAWVCRLPKSWKF